MHFAWMSFSENVNRNSVFASIASFKIRGQRSHRKRVSDVGSSLEGSIARRAISLVQTAPCDTQITELSIRSGVADRL